MVGIGVVEVEYKLMQIEIDKKTITLFDLQE